MRGAQTVDGVLHPEALPFADCHPLTRARIADEIGKVEGVEDQPVRGDFVSELKHPIKRRIGMRYSNEFYFVTPAALVNVGEIPPECGLVEAGYATLAAWKGLIGRHAGFFNYDPESRAYCMITVPAPWRDTPGPTWQLVAAMLRNQKRLFSEALPPKPVQERLQLL